MSFTIGDWVQVRPEHDIAPIFRPVGKPTTGRVSEVLDTADLVMVCVPIGDTVDPLTEHSQAVPYPPEALEKTGRQQS